MIRRKHVLYPRKKCEQGSFVYGHRNETNLLLKEATLEAYRLSQTPSGARRSEHDQI
jgi:hypothetical protein